MSDHRKGKLFFDRFPKFSCCDKPESFGHENFPYAVHASLSEIRAPKSHSKKEPVQKEDLEKRTGS